MAGPTKADGARALSIEEREVGDVGDLPAGLIVTTSDGVPYIIVAEDNPDADGKTGLMFLAAPVENYHGTFPVYAQPVEIEPDEPEPAEDAPEKAPARKAPARKANG